MNPDHDNTAVVETPSLKQPSARTAIACRRCHGRKTKCSADGVRPCSNCSAAGAECILIQSRRGKYPRRRATAQSSLSPGRRVTGSDQLQHDRNLGRRPGNLGSADPRHDHATTVQSRRISLLRHDTASPHRSDHDDDEIHESAWDTTKPTGTVDAVHATLTDGTVAGAPATGDDRTPGSPDSFYARIAENSVSDNQHTITEATEPAFLGEAFSLTYVVHHVMAPFLASTDPSSSASPSPLRLHFALTHPNRGNIARNAPPPTRSEIVRRQIRYLQQQRLLYFPAQATLHRLLACFFDAFHPAFPILDEVPFLAAVKAGEASLLVLSALLMVAVTICSDELLAAHSGPAISRYGARSIYYHQAKALYDAEQEPAKLDNIVGVFYMSFWWGGPDDQKDSWHWLGIASSLASSLGMHRSTKNSSVDSKTATLWKRLWWSIKIREALVSASIGRPRHIADMDCDIEQPSIDDVRGSLSGDQEDRLLYFVQMSRLSEIFSEILSSRYACSNGTRLVKNQQGLEDDLESFTRDIPLSLRYHKLQCDGTGLWAAMLSMAIKSVIGAPNPPRLLRSLCQFITNHVLQASSYATILLCRPLPRTTKETQPAGWGNRDKALAAANEVTRVTEDILSASVGRLCQIHTIPALFNAMAMHLLSLCDSSSASSKVGKGLAQARSDLCMLGLGILQESWPVGGWVYRLFASIRGRLGRELELRSVGGRSDHTAQTAQAAASRPPDEHETPIARASGAAIADHASAGPFQPGFDQSREAMDHAHGLDSWLPTPQYSTEISSPHRFLDLAAQDLALQDYFPDMFTFGAMDAQDTFHFL